MTDSIRLAEEIRERAGCHVSPMQSLTIARALIDAEEEIFWLRRDLALVREQIKEGHGHDWAIDTIRHALGRHHG
ncbi:MAG: hypothetical protein ACRDGM_19165 [bacterium]